MRADIAKLRRGLGSPKPPKDITQEPYERNPHHLRRLARGDWRTQLPKSGDLFAYVEDISFVEVIQPNLFRYMLPVLLEMWRQDFTRENRDHGLIIDYLYGALARRRPVKKLLGDRAEQAAGAFMGSAILDWMDNEKQLDVSVSTASFCNWTGALASLGVIFPTVESLWEEWWRVETPGQAAALLEYVSELIYESNNPLFPVSMAETDFRPSFLWNALGFIHDQAWRPENVDFLRNTLTAGFVEDGVRRATEKLRGNAPDDLLDRLVQDLPDQRPILERRVAALPEILSRPLDDFVEWDEAR